MSKEKVVLFTRYGDIDGDLKHEKVTLVGIPIAENSVCMKNLQIIIEKEHMPKQTFSIPGSGCNFNLFLGNILKGAIYQIVITGKYCDPGEFGIIQVYKYKDGKLELILDDESLSIQINCYASYEKNYKVLVSCIETNECYTMDISKIFKDYLNLIYDENGNVYHNITPIVSDVNSVYPVLDQSGNFFNLYTKQHIIGVYDSHTLGFIQSVIEVYENGKIIIKTQNLI
jgi:hypothetical protein